MPSEQDQPVRHRSRRNRVAIRKRRPLKNLLHIRRASPQPASSSSRRPPEEETEGQENIPLFSVEQRVTPCNARADRLSLGVELGSATLENIEDVHSFWHHLGGPPSNHQGLDIATQFSPLFTAAPFNGAGCRSLTVRQAASHYDDPESRLGKPLFSGNLYAQCNHSEGMVVCRPRTPSGKTFFLNPTTALNHRRTELLSDSPWRDSLFARTDGEIERGLDSRDNLLPAHVSQNDYLHGEQRYLESVFDALSEETRRAFHQGNQTVFMEEDCEPVSFDHDQTLGLSGLSLRSLETYWEFAAPDATSLLQRLMPRLRGYWKSHRDRTHGFDQEVEANETSAKLHMRKGVQIRVYAKKSERLRIEVVHRPPDSSRLLSPYTATSIDGLREMMDELREKAAETVNDLLAYLEEWSDQSPRDCANSSDFLYSWFQTMSNSTAAMSLLSLLRANGRIQGGKSLSLKQNRALQRAQYAGLLQSRDGLYEPVRPNA